MDNFLDFADVSNYLTFNLSVWKRGCACTISFELKMLQISSNPFWKALKIEFEFFDYFYF